MLRALASRELRRSSKRASSTERIFHGLRRRPSAPVKRAKPDPRSRYGPSVKALLLLPRELGGAALANDRDPDLTGVLELFLYLLRDVEGELGGDAVIHLGGLDHNPDLTPRLDRVGLLDPAVVERDVLQSAKPFEVDLGRLAPGSRSCS